MSKKDKQDLIEAICGYLPYAVYIDLQGIQGKCHEIKVFHYFNNTNTVQELDAYIDFFGDNEFIPVENFKLVLRPMSSMTEEERKHYIHLGMAQTPFAFKDLTDWLNRKCLDYRGLIDRNLAIESIDDYCER